MAGAPARVLVVEEEADGLRALTVMFERAGFAVIGADDVERALDAVRHHRVDCVVVDVAQRGHVGWQVLQRLRELSDIPVLVLTEGAPEADRVRGLLSGADDHLSKPVENEELVARIEVLLARRSATLDRRIVRTASSYDDGLITMDVPTFAVTVSGVPVALTVTEFRLLWALVSRTPELVSHATLLETAWDDRSGTSPDRVKFAVARLRRKLERVLGSVAPIESVRGVGYRYHLRS
jgi:DNA-binding response OmpR family regulator